MAKQYFEIGDKVTCSIGDTDQIWVLVGHDGHATWPWNVVAECDEMDTGSMAEEQLTLCGCIGCRVARVMQGRDVHTGERLVEKAGRGGPLVGWNEVDGEADTLPPPAPDLSTEEFAAALQREINDANVYVARDMRAAEEAAEGGYFGRKFDQNKADFTLLPADAVAYLLDLQDPDEDSAEDLTAEPASDTESLNRAAIALMASRTGITIGHSLESLADAFGWVCNLLGYHRASVGRLGQIVEVLEFGAKKYARDSWAEVPNGLNRYFSAAMRHLDAIGRGEDLDEDSNLLHAAHAACNIVFLTALTLRANAEAA